MSYLKEFDVSFSEEHVINIEGDFSPIGFKYSDADYEWDISKDDGVSSVKLYLFSSGGGYAAVVSGKGAMEDFNLTLHPQKGFKVMTETRKYADYLKEINKVYIERGVTEIGDFFMYNAYYLKEVIFEDSSKIKRLGKYCFGCTQISGEYKFCNLENGTTIDRSFFCCPKLHGITIGVDATENRSITLSELAFFGCLDMKHFIVEDPVNTSLDFGKACFEYCTGLELMEFQPENTTAEGLNFLMIPVDLIRLKRRMDVEKGIIAHTPIANVKPANWGARADALHAIECWTNSTNGSLSLLNCKSVASEYAGQRKELIIHETDEQKKDEYLISDSTPTSLDSKAVFWGHDGSKPFRVPYYGSCWLFAYMHIWNVLNPNEQYDTIENFVAKLNTIPITVDTELAEDLATWDFKDAVMATGVYADRYFDEGNKIYATDLPQDKISTDTKTTEGEPGTASWGVRKALGWTGERLTVETLTKDNRTAWADIKKSAVDSILKGKPVVFECVGYGSNKTTSQNTGGLHAVAAIGYDGDKDMFKVVDSTWGFPSDEIPMVYWTEFEAMLEPSAESAVWVFSSFGS